MSCFTDMPGLATGTPDPTKHVNYELGMVLGEDDFKQEFAYLSGRDQWLARDLIGYGTVRGLKVHTEWDGTLGPRIYVHPGVALTPAGQLVCVPSPQCANVNAWLKAHDKEVQSAVGSPPPNPLPLYLLLCYRECPDDNVPIPGEPCRTEDQLVKPSRLRDDFVLELSLKRPVQREERALRAFCELLRRVDMSDSGATSIALDRFLDELRSATAPWFSLPESPPLEDLAFGSPPTWMRVHPKDAPKYLRAAFHLWTMELRPKWFARWYGCAPEEKEPAPFEDCALLAEVQIALLFNPVTSAYQAVDGSLPAVIEDDRPYILHLRMLQEWLIGGASGLPTGSGSFPAGPGSTVTSETSFGLSPNVGGSTDYARADHTHGTPALPPTPSPAIAVTSETNFGQSANVGASADYARADHTHGTPQLPPLPALPSPGTIVTAETAFGQPAATGVSTDYARADHTHGTPALSAASAVTAETNFGQSANAGASADYARADHTHGTPTLPPLPAPGNAVTVETAFGRPAAAGASADYARADHTHGTPTLPPLPTPGNAVTAETAFGRSAAAGTSADYARADHTHGTPALSPASAVMAETSFGLSANVGASDNYARADHTHGTPALSPVPAAGSLVTSETAFGISPNAGTSPDYSRADHTHGTPQLPPVPAPGTVVVPEPGFGLPGSVGALSDYARADHTHGIPPIPGPGGDLGGTSISTAIVNRVRQIDVNTTGAGNGNVLMFVTATNSWQPRPLPPSQFVARASTLPYSIVAAGAIEFRLPPSVTVAPQLIFSYNKLEVLGAYDPANGGFRFRFIGYADVTLPGNRIQYIVKLTPWAPGGAGARNPFSAYFSDFVPAIGALEAGFTVTISPNAAALDTTVRLMIEVSQIG